MIERIAPGRARFIAVSVVAAGLSAAALAGGTGRADAAPPLDLIVKKPDFRQMELVRARAKHRVSDGLLLPQPTLRTGSTPLETWVHRLVPGEPAVVDLVDRSSGQPVATRVPGLEASMSDGLKDFIAYRITDGRGRVVYEGSQHFCPNGLGGYEASVSGRRPAGDRGRFPVYPFGSFTGLCGEEQAESLVWLTGPGNPAYSFGSDSFRLKDGRYRLVAVVNPGGILPERTLSNNRIVQRFRITTDRDLWRRLTGGPESSGSSGSANGGRTALGRRVNRPPGVVPPTAAQIKGPDGAVPDPAALPASKFGYDLQRGRARISFSSIVANFGDAPISLFGKRSQKKSTTMPAWQYLKDADGELTRRPTNGFVWDRRDGHQHWHYNELAVYELLSMDGQVLRRSGKVGFCFMPTTALLINPVPGPVGSGSGFGPDGGDTLPVSCGTRGSKRISMALESGWGDEYYQGIAGQSLDVTELEPGQYRLRITVNPEGDLAESNPANNVAERLIELGGSGRSRTLSVPRQGIVSPEFRRISDGGSSFRSAFRSGGQAAASRLLCGLAPRA